MKTGKLSSDDKKKKKNMAYKTVFSFSLVRMMRCRCHERMFIDSSKHDTPRFHRAITADSLTRDYSRDTLEWDPVHMGQMKLLISEIEFLTPFFGMSFVVVYAGAAPGVHIPILAGMFPMMHFLLIDPAKSMIVNGDYNNITVMQVFMTNELAYNIMQDNAHNILFISDVRVGNKDVHETEQAHQQRIQRDMEAQRVWMQILRPRSSILKFRRPWNMGSNITYYPAGSVYLPVYGKQFTHEARLILDRDTRDIPYDNRRYEGQMAYFNQVIRPCLYHIQECIRHRLGAKTCRNNTHKCGHERYRCYDCTSFQAIICEYLLQSGVVHQLNINYDVIEAECLQIETRLNYFYHVWSVMQHTQRLL